MEKSRIRMLSIHCTFSLGLLGMAYFRATSDSCLGEGIPPRSQCLGQGRRLAGKTDSLEMWFGGELHREPDHQGPTANRA